jgi:uncharacterized protein (DUF2252 family)
VPAAGLVRENVVMASHIAPPAARYEAGRDRRRRVPLEDHAELVTEGREDPVAILTAQDASRVQALVPIRHGRMSASAFTFYRGAAAVMAADLAKGPTTDLHAQLCGDAHLSNFGLFRAADREMVFDVNDFDETLPGPALWDFKRLVASVVIAGRNNGFGKKEARQAARFTARRYRESMADSAQHTPLEVHYLQLNADDVRERVAPSQTKKERKASHKVLTKARSKNSLKAFRKLTDIVDGRRVIVPAPPVVTRVDELLEPDELPNLRRFFDAYAETLPNHRRAVLHRYSTIDLAHKIVGVGSVGTRCFIVLLESGAGDPLFLQFKEATRSVLEDHLEPSKYEIHGERVVKGQRLLQASGDIFLGWGRMERADGRSADFYFRQLWDGKGSVDVDSMSPSRLQAYAGACGATLAISHARTGDSAMIAGYLGDDDTFDRAVARFGERYADLNEQDHERHDQAIADGEIQAIRDI